MKITQETVQYVAHLARLELEPEEAGIYTAQIDRILQYMDTLNTLDTEDIEVTSHVVPVVAQLRPDAEKASFDTEESLQNAPERRGHFFKVPPIIEVEE